MNPPRPSPTHTRTSGWRSPLVPLLLVALITRLVWLSYTNFTYEDAFITFRYAEQLAAGNGWAHNTGEQIYGTTTPLLTLLLAGWRSFSPDLVLGVRIIGVGAALATLALLWATLGRLGLGNARRIGALVALIAAEKLVIRDTGGMETPLVILLMVASWYALLREQPLWAGLLAGLLLWARIDTIPWLAALGLVAWVVQRRLPWRFALVAALCYTPWLVYASATFGSPLPYTVIAKQDAYVAANAGVPLLQHLLVVFQRRLAAITLLDLPRGWATVSALIATYALAVWGAWQARRYRWLLLLPLFVLLDVTMRVVSRSTFETRYFIPATWALLVLLGIGAGTLLQWLWQQPRVGRPFALGLCIAAFVLNSLWVGQWASYFRTYQWAVQEQGLAAMGQWLNRNTPPGSTVMLEPLGYVGYYADRRMIDEVGLIAPQIVALRQAGVTDICTITERIQPDYLLLHCDDAIRRQRDCGLDATYARVTSFNPLDFDPAQPPAESTAFQRIPRLACYETWSTRHAP